MRRPGYAKTPSAEEIVCPYAARARQMHAFRSATTAVMSAAGEITEITLIVMKGAKREEQKKEKKELIYVSTGR